MRISNVVLKNARRPAREPFPFQELLPLKLKTSVSAKGDKSSDVSCLQEMTNLFACLKKNEFNQALCSPEIQLFQNCYTGYMDKKRIKNEQEKKGMLLTPGAKKLNHKQINQLLQQFPQ